VRNKSLLGAAAGVLALAVAAVAIASPQLNQIADVKLTGKKTGKSTAVSALLTHTDPAAQPEGNIPATVKILLTFPKGTRANTNAAPQCNLSTTDIQNNRCPENTKIGSGTAKANIVFGAQGPVVQDVPATATVYNRRNAIAVRIVSEATANTPSTTIPIVAPLTKKGVLTVNVPQLQPAGPGSKVILTYVKLNIRKKSKTVGRGRNRRTINFLTTPKTCGGNWTTVAKHTYDDGDSRTVETTVPCTRPRRR